MRKYEKIETIWARDLNGSKKLMPAVYRDPSVEYLASNEWIWTEKVDGTNISVVWDGHNISFFGRTENASIPVNLSNKLNEIFMNNAAEEIFEQAFGEKTVIIYGEGYGNKIQNVGSKYIAKDVDFIVFDVLIGFNYQPRETVEEVAKMFGLKVVPVVGRGNLHEAVAYVAGHPQSMIAESPVEMEGIVCRPAMDLRDRCGNRIIVKIKWCDIKEIIS